MKKAKEYTKDWRAVDPSYKQISDFTYLVFVGAALGFILGAVVSYIKNPYDGFFRSYIFFNWRTLVVFPPLGLLLGMIVALICFALSGPLAKRAANAKTDACVAALQQDKKAQDILAFCRANGVQAICLEEHRMRMYPACGDTRYCQSETDRILSESLFTMDEKAAAWNKPEHWRWCDTQKHWLIDFKAQGVDVPDQRHWIALAEFLCDNLDGFAITKHRAYVEYQENIIVTYGNTFTYNTSTGRGYFHRNVSGGQSHFKTIYEDLFLYKL